jgi:hypothetical protein
MLCFGHSKNGESEQTYAAEKAVGKNEKGEPTLKTLNITERLEHVEGMVAQKGSRRLYLHTIIRTMSTTSCKQLRSWTV